jgi:hypothetical protein
MVGDDKQKSRFPLGGAGRSNSITGSEVTYAAGGDVYTQKGKVIEDAGASGTDHTGNGGSGARNGRGGAGGSGIVIVRLPLKITN